MFFDLQFQDLGGAIITFLLIALVIWLVVTNIRVVPQAYACVVERLGAYKCTWQVGLHFKIPLIDRVAHKVSLKEHVTDFPPQPVITKDNVTIEIDTVLYFSVTDPKLYAYGVENPMAAIENLTATTLRNIIGELELDQTLTSRELINTKIRLVLDEATDAWGIKINRVEVKNINPPKEIQQAMEKQMRAERERREVMIRAEGEKRSAILVAEGQKESMILQAEGLKQSTIRKAEGDAESIMLVQRATAEGIKLMVQSYPSKEVLTIKSLEAFEKAANGRATKIIIPSEIQGMAGLASSLTAITKEMDDEETPVVKGPDHVKKATSK
jgi:regulator of protease activity HflC (stomatin/prohibitin superfamily)